ncbi:MAG: hypothetical protein LBE71_00240 [Dysgonamonadaceae bacterium]|jgi:hypothetical protein|nr:hypothetical protein [Dysgonamonadaceae bacterium]
MSFKSFSHSCLEQVFRRFKTARTIEYKLPIKTQATVDGCSTDRMYDVQPFGCMAFNRADEWRSTVRMYDVQRLAKRAFQLAS